VISGQNAHIDRGFGAILAMVALVVAFNIKAEAATPVPSIERATARGAEDAPEDGPHNGIKVHGHWTIEVRNPDGTLATHREFENSLTFGARFLATALGRQSTAGLWMIVFGVLNSASQPCQSGTGPYLCLVVESADSLMGSNIFHTLTSSAPFAPDPNAGKLTLSGTATVQNTSQISIVETFAGACAPTIPPASCVLNSANAYSDLGVGGFSATSIAPISVTAGQVVQVTVVFSFS
jgi:hypothetical protein